MGISDSEGHFPRLAAREDITTDGAAKPLTIGDDHRRRAVQSGVDIDVATLRAV